jgi:hypothetical protein
MAGSQEEPVSRTVSATPRRPSAPRDASPDPDLSRVISATQTHLDDQSQYVGQTYNEDADVEDSESTDEADLAEKGTAAHAGLEPGTDEDVVGEERNGALEDLEAGKLKKTRTSKSAKSARSARDPNLVTWEGPDDPENPKNWTFKRKWAATLVGMMRSLDLPPNIPSCQS